MAGFVPGGDPLARDELVVLAAPLEGPGASAAVLAALVLAERSRWTGQPERTVQVAFWAGVPTSAEAVRQSVRGALWPRCRIRAVVLVADAPVAPVDSIPVVAVPPGGGGLPLAEALLDRTLLFARRPALSDTTSATNVADCP